MYMYMYQYSISHSSVLSSLKNSVILTNTKLKLTHYTTMYVHEYITTYTYMYTWSN